MSSLGTDSNIVTVVRQMATVTVAEVRETMKSMKISADLCMIFGSPKKISNLPYKEGGISQISISLSTWGEML